MSKKSPLHYKYNPAVSVKENAARCGVSVAAIRKFIQENNIDRKGDAAIHRQRAIKELRSKNPSISIAEIQRQTGYSYNTIRKYLLMLDDVSKTNTKKVSRFEISNNTIIKSVSDDQDEILCNILRLYVPEGRFECDFTYSIGNFYKHITQPNLKFDKYPQADCVLPLEKAEQIQTSSLNSVVVDLPFIVKDKSNINEQSKIALRFKYFNSVAELYKVNEDMLNLSFKVLKRGGILVVKTMDVCAAGGQVWVSDYVYHKAIELGFELLDKFILVSPSMYVFMKGTQKHARKYHSYFLVFKKIDRGIKKMSRFK